MFNNENVVFSAINYEDIGNLEISHLYNRGA